MAAPDVTIVVNTIEHEVPRDDITYEQVLGLAPAVTSGVGPTTRFTVTYRRGQGNKPSGELTAGESVRVKEGMLFDVKRTDRS